MKRVNISEPDFTYDDEDPEGFRAGMFRFGPKVGAVETGASVYELPPGQALCPYHYEYGEEEWLLVLAGTATLRHPEGTEELQPWDITCFPRGPEGAHQVRNESEETVRIMMFSTLVTPTATVYPDSGKIGVWTGNKEDDVVVRQDSAVGYYDGESRAEEAPPG
jgi:uncharacterized cupin superfamily protein